jgi:hypothetical protein
MRLRYLSALATLTGVLALVAGAQAGSGVKTAKPAYLVPAAPGVVVDPILSTGDIVGGYQMSGIPDGLGAYAAGNRDGDLQGDSGRGTFTVLMNHELGKSFPAQPPGVDARISRLVIDRKSRSVLDAEYLFTGAEGYERFCSSTLSLIAGRPFYFTGEEAVGAGHDGSSIALDPETGLWRDTKHFGRLQHENIVPLRLSKWIFLTSEDDFRSGLASYLYAYIANDFNKALRGTDGSLAVWKADDPAKTGNATVVKGESVPGHFVPISQAENATSDTLKAASDSRNAFKFDRLEDVAARPDVRGRVYVADTGKQPATLRGRVYQLDVDPLDPTKATLTMILDGDAGDDLINPDNMAASSKVLVIQEDRESAFRGDPNRVLVYDFASQTLKTVAQVHSPDLVAPPFNQESSGVIDASRLLGPNWWLLDVQAHTLRESQPGPSLEPNSSEGEDGQLDAIYIPHSTGG